MASRPPTDISYFEVVSTPGPWATYGKQSNQKVANGKPHGDQIGQAAKEGKLPDTVREITASPLTAGHRLLDIIEKKFNDDRDLVSRAYAFRLNAALNGRDLIFVEKNPFIALPTNFPSNDSDNFISKFEIYKEGTSMRWASFVCDLKAVRESALASRVKELAREHRRLHEEGRAHRDEQGERREHEHWANPLLTLPFCFNLIDPTLGASPWVIDPLGGPSMLGRGARVHGPSDRAAGQDLEGALVAARASSSAFSFFTHGGVHPATASFLVVEL